jgi:alpha-N-acetylglucosaminidase
MINYLYKLIIDDVTHLCYQNCLEHFSPGSRILDVGIGNGIMINRHHRLIRSKGLDITGIDINPAYLRHCRSLIRRWDLSGQIRVLHSPVEAYVPPRQGCFDYILFSMSFMLLSDQHLVLDRIRPWLTDHGEVVFFQTMFKDRSPMLEFIKPRLKYLTTVDFGRVTYESDFFCLLGEKDLSIAEDRMLKKEWFKGEYRLIISTPGNGNGRGRQRTGALCPETGPLREPGFPAR